MSIVRSSNWRCYSGIALYLRPPWEVVLLERFLGAKGKLAFHVPLTRYVKLWVACHRLQSKPLVSNPGIQQGTCVMHVPWFMSGSLTCGGGENVPGIPGACAARNFMYLARGPWDSNVQGNRLYCGTSHETTTRDGPFIEVPHYQIDSLAQDCSNSSALAMQLLQSCKWKITFQEPSRFSNLSGTVMFMWRRLWTHQERPPLI